MSNLRIFAAAFYLVSAGSAFGPLALAQTLEILHTFEGSDGASPQAGLILATDGNLYGTTGYGGLGYGTVFEIAPDGTQKRKRVSQT